MKKHSWLTISSSDARPLYLQIMEQIERRVAVGDLPPGTELPSIRELAASLQVSVITIKRAYLELERAGVISTRHGKGSFVADSPGLQSTLQEESFREHLRRSIELAVLLKMTRTEIQKRVIEMYDDIQREGK
jgi:GntR family transcriptional regulator